MTARFSLARLLALAPGTTVGGTLARGTAGAFAVKTVGIGVGFGVQVLLARVLGVEEYGIYTYILAWLGVLVLLAKMGWDTTLVRYVAAYYGKELFPFLRGLLRRALQVVAGTGVGIGVAAAIIVWGLGERHGASVSVTAWLACLLLPVMALAEVLRAALQGLKRIVLAFFPTLVLRPLVLGAGVAVAAIAGGDGVAAPVAMAINLLAVACAFGLSAWLLRSALGPTIRRYAPLYRTREWVRVALPLLLVSGMTLLLNQTDTIMVGTLLNARSAGIYATAGRIATLIAFGLSAANTIVAPMIAQLFSTGQHDELEHMVNMAMRGIFAFTVPVALAVVFFGEWILGWFGPPFTVGYTALIVLMCGQTVNALMGPVGLLMMMTEHEHQAARILVGSAVLNLILNAALIPPFGLEGAAAATAFTMTLWNLVMHRYVSTRIGVRPSIFRRHR